MSHGISVLKRLQKWPLSKKDKKECQDYLDKENRAFERIRRKHYKVMGLVLPK